MGDYFTKTSEQEHIHNIPGSEMEEYVHQYYVMEFPYRDDQEQFKNIWILFTVEDISKYN